MMCPTGFLGRLSRLLPKQLYVQHRNRVLISEVIVIMLPQGICLKQQGLKALSFPKPVNTVNVSRVQKEFIEKCMFSQTNIRSTVHVHLTFQQDIKTGIQSNILKQFQLPALKQFSVLVQKKATKINCGQQMRSVFPCLKKKQKKPGASLCFPSAEEGFSVFTLQTDVSFYIQNKNIRSQQHKTNHTLSF